MSCVVQWWDVLFVKDMHFSSKNARLLNSRDPLALITNLLISSRPVAHPIYSNLCFRKFCG